MVKTKSRPVPLAGLCPLSPALVECGVSDLTGEDFERITPLPFQEFAPLRSIITNATT